ncbi:MAG: DUF2516 family protein [Actinomycetia bacterium]|nr:DUF2516 family protein [Actinomycetes bacterium]
MEASDALGMGIGVFAIICWAIFALVGLFLFIVWIITLVDCAKRKNEEFPSGGENAKTIWLVVLIASWVVGLYWLAAILYYFMVMKKKPRNKG